jgi:hypothetical protein
MGPEWRILVVGRVTGNAGVLVASSGAGKVLVELGHPSLEANCRIDDAALVRYVNCLLESPVSVDMSSWGGTKAHYRE